MRRALALLLLLAAPAHAQIAGTADDPLQAMRLRPEITTSWFAPFAIRGIEPVAYVDGFEVPRLQHDFLGRGIDDSTLVTNAGVGYAGPNALKLDVPDPGRHYIDAVATTRDLSLGSDMGRARYSVIPDVAGTAFLADPHYFDLYVHQETRARRRWRVFGSLFWSMDSTRSYDVVRERDALRGTSGISYHGRAWTGRIATSALLASESLSALDETRSLDTDRTRFETRLDLARTFTNIASVDRLVWRTGALLGVGADRLHGQWSDLPRDGAPVASWPSPRNTIDADTKVWQGDVALWSSLDAQLTRQLRADLGLQFERFGNDDNLALTPRGTLDVRLSPQWRAHISAGAYRRPVRDGDALLYDLNPERTTQVSSGIGYVGLPIGFTAIAYYQDLSRLVARNAFGALRNTGSGRGYGVELMALATRGPWRGGLTLALGRSLRRDTERGAERPAALDQPLRAHVFGVYQQKRWSASARASVVSGLPVTPVQRAIYDADLDWYAPIFGRANSERLPYRIELAVRAERSFLRGRLSGVVDLLVGHGAVAYSYSHDYTERRSVTLPLLPFVGLRGTL